jgi:hypothetical protein
MDWPLSLPADPPRLAALVLSPLLAWLLPRWLVHRSPPRAVWIVAPLAAAALSVGYVHYYLRGGPRIIDATAYFLEAKALSHGMLAFPTGEPEQAVLGRFLVRTSIDGAPAASVIFPIGWPAVLALGFLVGAPLAVGPLLAAAITFATMDLARIAAREIDPAREAPMIRIAAVLSLLCATLRYHTADTMSHGLSALCVVVALAGALRVRRGGVAPAVALGGGLGLLFATRPASALALGLAVVAGGVVDRRVRPIAVGLAVLAAAPFVVLFFLHQHAATGAATTTAQTAYYLTSDGPPGCFAYGFSSTIGCRGEHGGFLDRYVPDGWGVRGALGTTGRRLLMHLPDALGFAPLLLLVLAGARLAWRSRLRMVALVPALQVAAYAPFYFDGNYPGGGGRMYADVIPVEHVLAVIGVLALAGPRWRPARLATLAVVLGLCGFALHLGRHHADLRDRDGGRPMLEPSRLEGLGRALVLVDTDHGFDLGFDPAHGPLAVRRHRGDAHDWLAWKALGEPPTYRYRFSWEPSEPAVVSLEPHAIAPSEVLEGEALWPAAAQTNAWAWPIHTSGACTSAGRGLRVEPTMAGGHVELVLPPLPAGLQVAPRLVGSALVELVDGEGRVEGWEIASEAGECTNVRAVLVMRPLARPRLRVFPSGPVVLDHVLVAPDKFQ